MMRCKACDVMLSDREARRKGEHTGEYIDFCDKCYETIRDQIEIERPEEDDDDLTIAVEELERECCHHGND